MQLILKGLAVGAFQSNCWILGCDETREGAIIDPGDEPERILKAVEEHALKLKYILHTHGHLDHVSATAAIQRETGASVFLHKADEVLLDNLALQATLFGLAPPERPTVDQYMREGDRISLGGYVLSVIETPGHSPGGVCLELEAEKRLFAGDTLFQGSIGRTDLWGASYQQLMDSIRRKLWPLDDETILYPGHGPSTTLGAEKRGNPFLQALREAF